MQGRLAVIATMMRWLAKKSSRKEPPHWCAAALWHGVFTDNDIGVERVTI